MGRLRECGLTRPRRAADTDTGGTHPSSFATTTAKGLLVVPGVCVVSWRLPFTSRRSLNHRSRSSSSVVYISPGLIVFEGVAVWFPGSVLGAYEEATAAAAAAATAAVFVGYARRGWGVSQPIVRWSSSP